MLPSLNGLKSLEAAEMEDISGRRDVEEKGDIDAFGQIFLGLCTPFIQVSEEPSRAHSALTQVRERRGSFVLFSSLCSGQQ